MPRSVILLSTDPDLFDSVRTALVTDPRFIDAGDAVHCDGSAAPLTNIYPVETNVADWSDWHSDASEMPHPRNLSQLVFECRSPEWVAEVGTMPAQRINTPLWFLDSDVVWAAGDIDPGQVVLD